MVRAWRWDACCQCAGSAPISGGVVCGWSIYPVTGGSCLTHPPHTILAVTSLSYCHLVNHDGFVSWPFHHSIA
ncbi:hypothetical protein QP313_18170, partial [Proteus mirabilis]|nr:hypothetical protein [Proteus mirabilis]